MTCDELDALAMLSEARDKIQMLERQLAEANDRVAYLKEEEEIERHKHVRVMRQKLALSNELRRVRDHGQAVRHPAWICLASEVVAELGRRSAEARYGATHEDGGEYGSGVAKGLQEAKAFVAEKLGVNK